MRSFSLEKNHPTIPLINEPYGIGRTWFLEICSASRQVIYYFRIYLQVLFSLLALGFSCTIYSFDHFLCFNILILYFTIMGQLKTHGGLSFVFPHYFLSTSNWIPQNFSPFPVFFFPCTHQPTFTCPQYSTFHLSFPWQPLLSPTHRKTLAVLPLQLLFVLAPF